MNKELLKEYLGSFERWVKDNKVQAVAEQKDRELGAAHVRDYDRERLLRMSEEEFFDYVSPLWAMVMWGNKHYQVDNIIEANGMELLREQFANLIYGDLALEERWDEFRGKVKGVGPAMMSELLCKTYVDECLIWNRKTYNGFSVLGVKDMPRYESRLNGKTYVELSRYGRKMVEYARENGYKNVFDLLTLNTFIWKEFQGELGSAKLGTDVEAMPKGDKEALFVHNDVRDKLAEIGRCLGFRTEVEKKIADGAVADAIWEATIGNMGRVIYVFEVQTSGSIDSLVLNLMKAMRNEAVQGVVAVTDEKQIEKIKREIAALGDRFRVDIKFWDYREVLKVHESLQYVNESINNLKLVPLGF